MIEITAANALLVYLGATLIAIFGAWIYHHLMAKKKTIISNPEALFVCEYCHFAYLSLVTKKVNQCPQCKSFNKDNRYEK